ncbi:DUF2383 domain-containing protein [Gemmata sp.]|uniref:DUF2383 domain-containing protein n=1 Tax=Gemmata sp. TaxID=1914242 RepID=UPI003F6FE0C4
MSVDENRPDGARDAEALAALLRSELAAVATYDEAVQKFEDPHALVDLQKIREDHARAVGLLRDTITRTGGRDVESPGPWPSFESAVGDVSRAVAFAALKQGEQHSVNEYELALENDDVDPECKALIRSELLPRDREHVEQINRLLGGMA